MPGGEGKWPLAAILDWKLQRDVVRRTEAAAGGDDAERKSALDRKREADARKSEADAHAKELKNQVVEGNVLFRDDVERQLAEFLTTARDNFMRLPRVMLPMFPRDQVQDLASELEKEIRKVLGQLAEFTPVAGDADEVDAVSDSAANPPAPA